MINSLAKISLIRGQILFLEMKEDSSWTVPKFAEFSSEFSEVDPIFSPDGSKRYFTSNRPTSDTTDATRNNIWFVEKSEDGWSIPQLITLTETGDYYSSITKNGDIYFNTWSNGDIYRGIKTDSTYFDNGSWNIFYTSTSFIERLRTRATAN